MPSAKSGSGAWRVTSPHSYHVALGFGVSREIVGKKRRWFPNWEGKNHHREHRGHRERRVRGNRGLALGSSLPMLQPGTKSPTYTGGRDTWAVGVQDLPRPTPRSASRRTGHPAICSGFSDDHMASLCRHAAPGLVGFCLAYPVLKHWALIYRPSGPTSNGVLRLGRDIQACARKNGEPGAPGSSGSRFGKEGFTALRLRSGQATTRRTLEGICGPSVYRIYPALRLAARVVERGTRPPQHGRSSSLGTA